MDASRPKTADTVCPICARPWSTHVRRCYHVEFLGGRIRRCLNFRTVGRNTLYCKLHGGRADGRSARERARRAHSIPQHYAPSPRRRVVDLT